MTTNTKDLKDLSIPADIELYGDCPMRCGDKTVMQFFLDRVASGVHPRMAETLAMQQAPGVGVTGKVFQQDQNRHGRSILDRMNGDSRAVERLRKQLAKRGYKLKSDDHYIPTAARFPGDPLAIVSNTNSHNEVQKHADAVAEKRAAPKAKTRLSNQIVNRIAEAKIKQDPSLALKDRRSLNESIVEQHGSKGGVV